MMRKTTAHHTSAIMLLVLIVSATVDAFVTTVGSPSSSLVNKKNSMTFATSRNQHRKHPLTVTNHLLNPIIIKKYRNNNGRRRSSSYHLSVANRNDNDDETTTTTPNIFVKIFQKLKLQQAVVKVLNNIFFILTIPFPELRTLVLQNRRRNKNKAKQDSATNNNMEFSLGLKEGLFGLLAYFAVGVFFYHKIFEKYSFVDALYYTCVCFSTVGYGDLCPATVGGKIFTCIFSITGIALLGACVASIGSTIVQVEKDAANAAKKVSRKQILNIYDKMPKVIKQIHSEAKKVKDITTNGLKSNKLLQKLATENQIVQEKNNNGGGPLMSILAATRWIIRSLSFVFLGGLLIGYFEGWHWGNSVYYSFITASTIGLGDFSPQTRNGRLCAVIFIPMAVAAIGEVLAAIGLALVERRQKTIFKNQLNLGLSKDHLKAMDVNGDGTVDREEYVLFMLLEMGLINQSEIETLFDQFERLDVSKSGVLDQSDLMMMAQLREQQQREEQENA